MPSRRVRVGSPAHTRSILRDFHRAYVEEQKRALPESSEREGDMEGDRADNQSADR